MASTTAISLAALGDPPDFRLGAHEVFLRKSSSTTVGSPFAVGLGRTHWDELRTSPLPPHLLWRLNEIHGDHSPAGVMAFDSLLKKTVDKVANPAAPALVILGDSTVDVGVNNYLITPVKSDWLPYGRDFPTKKPTGRFCNGKLIGDYLAEHLGLPYPLAFLDPLANGSSLLQGINTGSSGSGYFDITAVELNVKTMPEQIQWVKAWQKKVAKLVGNVTAASITSEAVFIMSTGSNDWVNNYYVDPIIKLVYNTTQYINMLLDLVRLRIQDMYDLGARRIAVVSLPPLGCIPFQILVYDGKEKCIEFINNDTVAFNTGVQNVITYLMGTLPGSKIVYLDAYTLIYDAFSNPSKYGIVNNDTSQTCCETGGVPETGPFCNELSTACPNADDYLFWDAYHPTQLFNKQAADAFYSILAPAMGLSDYGS